MIIQSVTLENFQCYYDLKEFRFSPGLNIILGDNGEGKTKFFEGVEWLFNGDRYNLEPLVSKKKIKEEYNNDPFPVSVSMRVDLNDQKYIFQKSFLVESKQDGVKTSEFQIVCIHTNEKGEREKLNENKAIQLLDETFPPEIRRYSLFKGESELDIFKTGEEALSNLVKSFSDAKHYDKYCRYGKYLREKAEKAVDNDVKQSSKSKREFDEIEQLIVSKSNKLNSYKTILYKGTENLEKLKEDLQEADKHFDNAESLKAIKARIAHHKEKQSDIQRRIVTDFTTRLFDEKWLLIHFEDVQNEFNAKISAFDKNRRDEEERFNIEKGKAQLSKEILEKVTPLPVGVPSVSHMKEMLAEEYCKVCNRKAEKGSEPYLYMEKRLKEFADSQKPNLIKPEQKLYKFNYLAKLWSMSDASSKQLIKIRSINQEIKDTFDFNARLKTNLSDIEDKLEKEERDFQKIIAKSNAEEDLISIYNKVREWRSQEKHIERNNDDTNRSITSLESEIKNLKVRKESIGFKDAKGFLVETQSILRDIEKIFLDVRENKYDEFLQKIEQKSNEIFSSINVDDFTGEIRLVKEMKGERERIRVDLLENENIYLNPNQSLQTTKHMAVLFAISEIASELSSYGSGQYPMIFDAPTSSFGMKKTMDFLNLVNSTDKQRIIATYEFVGRNANGDQIIEEEFSEVKRSKAFWLKRETFDKNDLSTINTTITPI